jgi:protein-S-isoprenylcysteine O-methyltransferase Ste14
MATILWLVAVVIPQSIVFLYPPVILFWLVMHSNIKQWRKIGKRAYWIACLAWPALALPLLYFREELFAVSFQIRAWNVVLGAVAILGAVRLGSQAAQIIPARTLVGLPELEPSKNIQPLLRSGIYSRTRNPVYLTHWLVILASALWSGYAANWGLFALDTLFLPLMIRAEEKELFERYGAEF